MMLLSSSTVMAGPVPAIQAFLPQRGQEVDARGEPGHDEGSAYRASSNGSAR